MVFVLVRYIYISVLFLSRIMANNDSRLDVERDLLTPTQLGVLGKLRASGTKNFSRSDYIVLKTIKQNCRDTLKHYDAAKHIFIEIDELMRG